MGSSKGQGGGPRAGGLIVLVFGFIFVVADASGLHGGLQAAARVAAIIVGLVLFSAISRARRGLPPNPPLGPKFWMIVAAEVIALFGGLVLINGVTHAHALTVPWIAVVVGVHFFGFVPLWKLRIYAVLGVLVTALGVAGFVLYAGGASKQTIQVVSGIGSGVVFYLAAADSLVRLRRSAAVSQTVRR